MKTVTSSERATGMGASHFAAILYDGKWVPISKHPGRRYVGRQNGYETYEVDVADASVVAQFDCSNRGNEYVIASNDMQWRSFEEADRWAWSLRASPGGAAGGSGPTTCPHCGREM